MSDYLPHGTGLGPGGSYDNDDGRGGGGWFRGLHQRSRTTAAIPEDAAAYDGNGDDGNTTGSVSPSAASSAGRRWSRRAWLTPSLSAPPSLSTTTISALQDNIDKQKQEQAWENLDRERQQKTHYRPDEDRDYQLTTGSPSNSPSKQKKIAQSRQGITFPQRVSSLLNLSGIGGGGGNERKSRVQSPFKPFVPSGIDPRTPADNPWQIPAVASAPGPHYMTSKSRKKSLFFANCDREEHGNGDDEEAFGYRRFPKVGESSQAVGTWHNPNLMQIVETLQTAMMNKRDPMEHIPVVYNSYVMMLIEAFGKLTTQLQCSDSQIRELKELREKELEEFRGMSEEWIQRENGYKAEIKRLELVLAKESKDGVASVAMARHHSLVDRSGSKRFQARLKRMSGSHQEDVKEQPVKEEIEATSIAQSPNCYRNIDEVPRSMDVGKDVMASRLVEKLERDDKTRKESEAMAVRDNRNAYDSAQGHQKQASHQVVGKKGNTTAHKKSRDAKTLRSIPEPKGTKGNKTLSRVEDDGLTVGRETYRSATTVHNASRRSPTAAGLPAQYKPTAGFSGGPNLKRETLGTSRQNLELHHVTHRAGRRYSFSHGDDEILPVSPLATSFEEAESRHRARIPAGHSQSGGPQGTLAVSDNSFNSTDFPLSTSSSSTGSVVWLGEGGNGDLVRPEQHGYPPNYVGTLSGAIREDGLSSQRSESVYLPPQAASHDHVSNLSGRDAYSPVGFPPASSSQDGRGEAGSLPGSYASPTIRAVMDVDMSQAPQLLPTGEHSVSPHASLALPHDNINHSSETTSNVAHIAATWATKRDGQTKMIQCVLYRAERHSPKWTCE